MKHLVLWLIVSIAVVILAIAGIFVAPLLGWGSHSSDSAEGTQQNVIVTEANFPTYLASTNLVKDLPGDASIILKTEKKTYAVQAGSVTEGSLDNPDMIITIPSSYIPKLSNGFCTTMQEAYKSGDLSFSLNIGSASAAWKYRTLLKYKSCLGI